MPAEKIVKAARLYGRAKTGMVMHARGIEHHTNGVNNVLSYINIVLATGKIGEPGQRLRHDHRTGQRSGRARARAKSGSTSRPAFDAEPGTSQARLPGLGIARRRVAAGRRLGRRDVRQDARGRDSRPALDLQQRDGQSARHEPGAPLARRIRLLRLHRFLHVGRLALRGCRPARLGLERRRRRDVQQRGARRQDQQGERSARRGAADWWIVQEIARRMGRGKYFSFNSPREIFDELRVASRGGNADYYGIT